MLLVSAFSATGLVLSLVGIYGVLSFSIAQRRLEFGIRIALGAHRRDILKLVMKQGMILAGLGVGVGICAALISTKLQATVLYGTETRDLTTFVVAPILFLAVAAFASYLPASRAMKVDPLEALK